MGAFQRLRRLLRGGLFRNPDATLLRMCGELEARLLDAHAEISAAEQEERRLVALTSDTEWLAARMLDYARRALRIQREDWAREAVARHLQAANHAHLYAQQWQSQQQDVRRLRRMIELMETRLADLEYKRYSLAARRRLTKTEHRLLKDLSGEETWAALAVVEEQALTDEYTTRVYGMLLDDRLTDSFDPLPAPGAADQVDYTLAALRAEIKAT